MSSKTNKTPSSATAAAVIDKEDKSDEATAALSPSKEEKPPAVAAAPDAEEKPDTAPSEEEEIVAGGRRGEGNDILNSIGRLRGFSTVLSNFTRRFRDMENHLKCIQEKLKELDSKPSEAPQQQKEEQTPPAAPTALASDPPSELERICNTMNSKALRKYIADHLSSDVGKLRDEVSAALKRVPDPARLILDCIGRFFLQGSKAFSRDSPMVAIRNLSVLILEFFILSGCSKIEPPVKDEAEKAAVAWRSRLVHEGGIHSASSDDALGLLLLVAAYGIPSEFETSDLCDLIRVSNLRKKADVLRCSPSFLWRFQDIIQGMVNGGLHVSAVDLACALELEDNFSPQFLLSSFVRETNQTAKKMRREGQGSREAQKEACEKQLAALKSVVKCLEDHRLNSVNLAGWKINEKIANLDTELSNFLKKSNEKAVPKRKAIELGSSEKDKIQAKRHQPTSMKASPRRPLVLQHQEQHFYDALLTFNGGLQGSLNGFPGALHSDGSGVGLLRTGNIHVAVAGSSAGAAAGAWSLAQSGVSPSMGNAMGPVVVYGSGMRNAVGSLANNGVGLNRWHWDGAYDGSVGQKSLLGLLPSAGQRFMEPPASTMDGFAGLPCEALGSNIYQFADIVLQGKSHHNSTHVGNTASAAAPSAYHSSYY